MYIIICTRENIYVFNRMHETSKDYVINNVMYTNPFCLYDVYCKLKNIKTLNYTKTT